MPWNDPVDRTPGTLITASIWNRDQDNFRFLEPRRSARVYNSGAQSIGTGAWTALTWDTESFDFGTQHDIATNTSRITPTAEGVWCFVGQIDWATNTTGARGVRLRLNAGGTLLGISQVAASPGTINTRVQAIGVWWMNGTTDYVEVEGWQDSGGNLNADTQSWFAAWLLHRAT